MFNSSNSILSQISENDSLQTNDEEGSMNNNRNSNVRNLKDIKDEIKNLVFVERQSYDLFNNDDQDRRLFSIKVLINTENNYLDNFEKLIQMFFPILFKETRKLSNNSINKAELTKLYDNYPSLYEIHQDINKEIRNPDNFDRIGEILIKHFSHRKVLFTYMNYIQNFMSYSVICFNLKSGQLLSKNPEILQMESSIMLPIQRFPQLECVIGDIYKNTADSHSDKLNLYKALTLVKSLSMRLDYSRKVHESSNCENIFSHLKKLKIQFVSKKIFSRSTVNYINYNSKDSSCNLVHCNLLLCDQEVIIYPTNTAQENSSSFIFIYKISNIEFQFKNFLFHKKSQYDFSNDYYKFKQIFKMMQYDSDTSILNDTFDKLNDYYILLDILEKYRKLKFSYPGIETINLSKSLLVIENQLSQNEREINQQLTTFLTLKIDKKDMKMLQFNSTQLANSWKVNFYRTKLLLDMEVTSDWWYYPSNKKIMEINNEELPLLSKEYILNNNGIINITCNITHVKVITIIVSMKLFRCLWILLENGQIITLYFNYKTWNILESIETNIVGPNVCVESVSIQNNEITTTPYNTEIWIGNKEEIVIYSLLDENRSSIKTRIMSSNKILGLCFCNNRMLMLLDNLNVAVYKPTRISKWINEYNVKMRDPANAKNRFKDISFIDSNYIFIIFDKLIYLIEYNVNNKFHFTKTESFQQSISAFDVTNDGIWVCTENSKEIVFYDKYLKNKLLNIEIPKSLIGMLKLNTIGSILSTQKYLWLGMDNGLIICVTIMDSLYCINNEVPLYFSTSALKSSVKNILSFQNIHGISVNNTKELLLDERTVVDHSSSPFYRSNSIPSGINWNSLYPPGLHLPHPSQNKHRQSDSVLENINDSQSSNSSTISSQTENLQKITPNLILVIGNGFGQIFNNQSNSPQSPYASSASWTSAKNKKSIPSNAFFYASPNNDQEDPKSFNVQYNFENENVLLTFLE